MKTGNIESGVLALILTLLVGVASAGELPEVKAKRLERAKVELAKYFDMPKEHLLQQVKAGFEAFSRKGLLFAGDPIRAFAQRDDVGVDEKGAVLTDELKAACALPPAPITVHGGEMDLSLVYRQVLAEALHLAGPGVVPYLNKELTAVGKSHACRPWFVIALAYHGDRAVVGELLAQSVEASDFAIRANSVRAFCSGGAMESMPVNEIKPYLEKWLKDPYRVDGSRSDVKFAGKDSSWNDRYPVRDEALSVLLKKKIRYKVNKHDYTLIE